MATDFDRYMNPQADFFIKENYKFNDKVVKHLSTILDDIKTDDSKDVFFFYSAGDNGKVLLERRLMTATLEEAFAITMYNLMWFNVVPTLLTDVLTHDGERVTQITKIPSRDRDMSPKVKKRIKRKLKGILNRFDLNNRSWMNINGDFTIEQSEYHCSSTHKYFIDGARVTGDWITANIQGTRQMVPIKPVLESINETLQEFKPLVEKKYSDSEGWQDIQVTLPD